MKWFKYKILLPIFIPAACSFSVFQIVISLGYAGSDPGMTGFWIAFVGMSIGRPIVEAVLLELRESNKWIS
jgi:hypothetical protein